MTTINTLTVLFIVVPILGGLLLVLNLLLAVHNPDNQKIQSFECGFSAFSQTRSRFSVAFYLVGILFLLFDLEIILIFPYAVSAYNNEAYGLWMVVIFILILTLGFVFEFGKEALKITTTEPDDASRSDAARSLLVGRNQEGRDVRGDADLRLSPKNDYIV
jgi:NADH-ubiquinone oxidoreductase chain 3